MEVVQMQYQSQHHAVEKEYAYKASLSASGYGDVVIVPRGDLQSIGFVVKGNGYLRVTQVSEQELLEAVEEGLETLNELNWVVVPDQAEINRSIVAFQLVSTSGVVSTRVGIQ